jgi:hydrogenase expression/formation protein HypE
MANEGRFICIVESGQAEKTLEVMKSHPESAEAAIIGKVSETSDIPVSMTTVIGTSRPVDMIMGEQLPRIC